MIFLYILLGLVGLDFVIAVVCSWAINEAAEAERKQMEDELWPF